jgi:hypothetical protein
MSSLYFAQGLGKLKPHTANSGGKTLSMLRLYLGCNITVAAANAPEFCFSVSYPSLTNPHLHKNLNLRKY